MEDTRFKALFYFMNENYAVVEVERIGLPTDTEKSFVLHWLLKKVDDPKLIKLNFKSMSNEVVNDNEISIRVFDEAELRFDDRFAKFSYKNDSHILMTEKTTSLPKELNATIETYLESL
jgi:hypothetical protein